MTTMKVAQVSIANGQFEIVERPIPQPAPGTVRIKLAASGGFERFKTTSLFDGTAHNPQWLG